MELLRFLLRADRWSVIGSILASAVSGLCTIGVLALVRLAMFSQEPAAWLVWAFAGVCAAALATKLVSQRLLISLSQQTGERLTGELSERILATPLARLERLDPSRVQAVLTTHVAAISQGVAAIPLLVGNVAVVVACLGYMAWLSPIVAACALGALALGGLMQGRLMAGSRADREAATQSQADVQTQVRHLLGGIKELKLHSRRRQAFLLESLWPTVRFHQRQSASGRLSQSFFGGWGRGMLYVLIGAFVFGVPLVVDLDRATLTSYIVAAFFLLIPLQGLKQAASTLAQARASLGLVERLGAELAAEASAGDSTDSHATTVRRTIELAGVEHAYHGGQDESRFRLGPLDLTFVRGELVFLGGGNGSGKTTLAKIVAGLYAPERGEIRVDGAPVTDANREAYRQNFSAVFAECHVFPSLLGLDESPESDGRIRELLVRFRLDRKVRVHRGTFANIDQLSPGQRKRLALIAALLEDRPFYVFDEWAADQDSRAKALFYLEILPELKAQGRTALVITHDVRYRHVADRLLTLDEGRLASAEVADSPTEPDSALRA